MNRRNSAFLLLFTLLFFSCTEDETPADEFSATVGVSASNTTVQEGGEATFTITLSEENSSGSALSIPFTLAGTATASADYNSPGMVAEIGSGETSTTVTIAITDDTELEENETIILRLGTLPKGITATANEATVTIQDNDNNQGFSAVASVTTMQSSVSEDVGTITFDVALDKQNTSGSPIDITLAISGTATASEDYTTPNLDVQIALGETSTSVEISIIDDILEESDETITLSLETLPGSITAGTSSATVTILDNDQAGTSVALTFGTPTGSSIAINGWTDIGANSYLVVISDEDSFTDLTDQSNQLASRTYVGYGEQVVYNGSTIRAFEVSLLSANSQYYFKVIPKTGTTYDNAQAAESGSTDNCVTTSTSEGQVCFDISTDLRTISSNQLANHSVGSFPNADPTAIEVTRELDLSPTYTGSAIYVYDETGPPTPMNDNFWQFGIATNGVEFHPMGLKPWENPNTGEENWEWQAKVTEEGETGLDAYGAHVTSQGNYHYHGDITGLADEEDGSRHSLIYGFAADGFPIYYKYGYSDPSDPTSSIIELQSSYRLKSGSRTATGTAGLDYPDGTYDGTYIQDFEYVADLGDLDECNGREGVTPEFPNGTYYYVITSDFPVTPNCFFGTPADDWKIGK